jgi:hypothetical protein
MKINDFVEQVLAGKHLFHFTDDRNLPSIRQHGLLSIQELKRRAIGVEAPGGNDWSHDADHHYGLDKYVHLCVTNQHPMEYRARQEGRIASCSYLKISPQALLTDGTLFSLDVSNKAGVPIHGFEAAAPLMDIEAMTKKMNWKDPAEFERVKAVRKYEVLIPNSVSLELITGL